MSNARKPAASGSKVVAERHLGPWDQDTPAGPDAVMALSAAAGKAAATAPSAPTATESINKVYQHWADGDATMGTGAEWNNNILSANKSDYMEGEVIPHLFVYKGSNNQPLVNGQSYSFNITYNHYQANTNAGGFTGLETFDISRHPSNWPIGGTPSADSSFTNGGGTSGLFYAVNADITSVSAVTYTGSNSQDGHVTVTFTYTGPSDGRSTAEVYYGLQIAGPGDVADHGLGQTNGAHAWTGGSLQTTVDIGGKGATSLQLSPAAILYPGLSIDKVVLGVYQSDGVTPDGDGIADQAGDIIKYNVHITNTGNVKLTGVSVTDPLTGQHITGVTLDVGASADYASQYAVLQSDLDNRGGGDMDIDNTATADSDQTDPVSDSESVPLAYTPMLEITKQFLGFSGGNGNTIGDWAGDVLSYRVTLTNTGNITLTGVTITDPLTGQDISGVTLNPGQSQSFDSQYTLTQDDLDSHGGGDMDIDNTATADSNETDPVSASAFAPLTYTPSMSVDKVFLGVTGGNGNDLADAAGDILHYAVSVTNTDSVTLTGVTIVDPLTGQDLSGITLAPGETKTFESSYVLQQEDLDTRGGGDNCVDNTATADSEQTDPVSDSVCVPLVYAPQMMLYKDIDRVDGGNGDAVADAPGDVIHYTVSVQNTGNITLTGVTVSDPLTGLDISGVSVAPGQTQTFDASYTLTQADLDGNGGGDGDIDNTATADSAETDPMSASAAEPLELRPLLSLDKHVAGVDGGNGNAVADADGDVIHYQLTVHNLGNITLDNVRVVDPLTGADLTLATLAPDASYTWDTSYTLTQTDLDNNVFGPNQIDNLAEAWSNQTGVVTDGEAVPVLTRPVLYIDKTASGITGGNGNAFADANGDILHFVVTVANQGNVTLTNVHVQDDLGGIDETLASLAPGESRVYDTSYTLTQADIDNNGAGSGGTGTGAVIDTATAHSDQTDPSSDAESVQLIRYPVLVLNKVFTGVTGGDGDLLADAPGDQLNYTFVLANAGNVTLTDVSLMDAKTGIALTGITLDPGMVQTRFGSYTLTQADIDQNGDGNGYLSNTATADSAQTLAVTDAESVPIARTIGMGLNETFTGVSGGNGNGLADAAGDVLNFSFTISNPGSVTLTDVALSDPLTGFSVSGVTIDPGTSTTYTASYTLTQADLDNRGSGAGTLDNLATVTSHEAAPVTDGESVTLVYDPMVDLTKLVSVDNGLSWEDANAPTGPTLLSTEGHGPLYKFVVVNTGNITLAGVDVSDSAYDLNGSDPGTAHHFDALAPGESAEWVYTDAPYQAGTQSDVATAVASGMPLVTDTDNAYYLGA